MNTVAEVVDKQDRKTHSRWTDDEVKLLIKNIKFSDKASQGIEKTAEEIGRSVGTVRQKYYSIAHKSSVKKSASAIKKVTQKKAVASPKFDLQALSLDAIIELQEGLRAEVLRRREHLNTQLERLQAVKP